MGHFQRAQLFLNDLERGGNSPLMRSTDGNPLKGQRRRAGCGFGRGVGNRTKTCSVTVSSAGSKVSKVSEEEEAEGAKQKSPGIGFRAPHRHKCQRGLRQRDNRGDI